MKITHQNILPRPLLSSLLLACTLFSGCSSVHTDPTVQYDLGQVQALDAPVQLTGALTALSVAEISTPAWLDNQQMLFRLTYVNDQQPRHFSAARWTMPPAQLFNQRLKVLLAQAGSVVVPASDGAAGLPLLRLEADDFSQVFASQNESLVQISIRASLFNARRLVAQKTFMQRVPTSSADAAGGVRALAKASDSMIGDMMQWLAGQNVK
ncbi:MAG: ABC-type transport auxiliary lipoprotein family protein [Pseudomonadota bacterium]